ncbi:hypothetical protein EIZ39_20435 [Ammoniphilus sp. CFH 90114]|nr:hypothetical protein EIZ39_20435 [Ammoniphilus sp. CFH 90114]
MTLTATITKGAAIETKTFVVKVLKQSQTDAEAVANAKGALAVGYAAGDSASGVTQDLTLATMGADGTTITWSTDNSAVIAADGTISRPAYSAGDATVTLTATITKGAAIETKTFVVKVLKQSQTDAEAVANAKGALAVGYAAGDSASGVTQDLTLATMGADGTSVTWSSDNPAVIAADGTISRPAYSAGDATVTLTATIAKGAATETKTFVVKVLKQSQTDAEAVANAKGALAVGYTAGDSASGVTQDLTLATMGADGTTITWSSNKPSVITATGKVNRPVKTSSDEMVTLTATIRKGAATETKVFTVKVLKQMQSDTDAVAEALAALTIGYRTGDSAANVTKSLSLSTTGLNGTVIEWSSNLVSVLNGNGTVERPAANTADAMVMLTATVRKGAVVQTKTFNLIVKKFEAGMPFTIGSTGDDLGLDRKTGSLTASVKIDRNTNRADHVGKEVVVFQLMKNNREPVSIVALYPDIQTSETLSATFHSIVGTDSGYSVKVFVFDRLTTDATNVQTNLAEPVVLN